MLKKLKEIYLKFKLKNKNVYLKENVKFKETIFHGRNEIGENSRIKKAEIGYGSSIGENCNLERAKIGKFCSLGNNILIITGNHPSKNYVSTHSFCYSEWMKNTGVSYKNYIPFDKRTLEIDKRISIEVGNDVWIGESVLILGGITIGDGAIIAAGAVVTKNVEPYTIVGGVSAKEIRKRFELDEIEFLQELKWWDKDDKWIEENIEYFADIKRLKEKMR